MRKCETVERGGFLLLRTEKRNPVRFEDGVAYLTISRRSGEKAVFLVDEDDYHGLVGPHRWSLDGGGYVGTNTSSASGKGQVYVKLHRLLLGFPSKGKKCDHINRDKKH